MSNTAANARPAGLRARSQFKPLHGHLLQKEKWDQDDSGSQKHGAPLDEEDIHRPPQSSSDEESGSDGSESDSSKPNRRASSSEPSPTGKRRRTESATGANKARKKPPRQNDASRPGSGQNADPSISDSGSNFLFRSQSSGSTRRTGKRPVTYGAKGTKGPNAPFKPPGRSKGPESDLMDTDAPAFKSPADELKQINNSLSGKEARNKSPEGKFAVPPKVNLKSSTAHDSAEDTFKAPALLKLQKEGSVENRARETSSESEFMVPPALYSLKTYQKTSSAKQSRKGKTSRSEAAKNASGSDAEDNPPSSPASSTPSSPSSSGSSPRKQPMSSIPSSIGANHDPPHIAYLVSAIPGENLLCPACSKSISRPLLIDFLQSIDFVPPAAVSKSPRLLISTLRYNVRQALHKKHSTASAWETWRAAGYPEIDWSSLQQRVKRHLAHLRSIINGERDSHWRDRTLQKAEARAKIGGRDTALGGLQKDMLSQGDRGFNEGDEDSGGATAGYYGPKGSMMIQDILVHELSRELRDLGDRDQLIGRIGGGVAGFIQAVLMPEVVQWLVVEDMRAAKGGKKKKRKGSAPVNKDEVSVDDMTSAEIAAARERMHQSAYLGRLLCDEEDQTFARSDSEDEQMEL